MAAASTPALPRLALGLVRLGLGGTPVLRPAAPRWGVSAARGERRVPSFGMWPGPSATTPLSERSIERNGRNPPDVRRNRIPPHRSFLWQCPPNGRGPLGGRHP